jgi:shikimate dehydrogenase
MQTPRAFVMGHPIGHSRSPMMHSYWLRQQGLDGRYEPLDVAPDDLAGFFAAYRERGWVGGNVTVPHKLAVIPHLDAIDDDAAAMGAVNTIWWKDGALTGGNTDSLGFMGNLDERAPAWERGAGRAVVIGAGGATRAAVYGLLGRGLDVAICNRTLDKAEALAQQFGNGVRAHGMDALPELMQSADLLVNTTSLGMAGQPPLEIDLAPLKAGAVVYDVIYVPLETPLLKQAAAKGHPTVDGLGMLLHQGVVGFRRWFGKTPAITDELRQLLIDDIRANTPGA